MLYMFTLCWVLAWALTIGVYGLSLLTEPEHRDELISKDFVKLFREPMVVSVKNVGYNSNYTMAGVKPVRTLPQQKVEKPIFGDEENLESIYDENVGKVSPQKLVKIPKAVVKQRNVWENNEKVRVKRNKGNKEAMSALLQEINGVRIANGEVKRSYSVKAVAKDRPYRKIKLRDKRSGEVVGFIVLKK